MLSIIPCPGRKLCLKAQLFPRKGLPERKPGGAEPQRLSPASRLIHAADICRIAGPFVLLKRTAGAVQKIPCQRMSDGCHVYPDLVGSPVFQPALKKGPVSLFPEHLIEGSAGLSLRRRSPQHKYARHRLQRKVNHPLLLPEYTLGQRRVGL